MQGKAGQDVRSLYITADVLNDWTGGSKVVTHESSALREISSECLVWDRNVLEGGSDPWGWDYKAVDRLERLADPHFDLVHFYAGCFVNAVEWLRRSTKAKIVYTVAAHDVERSKQAHFDLGLDFPYTHLTDPNQFRRYAGGYLQADVVVCPGKVPAWIVEKQGRMGPIEIIPHGYDPPKCRGECGGETGKEFATGPNDITDWTYCSACGGSGQLPLKPLPQQFVCGYLGAYGADKGIKTLLEAWKKLNYGPNAVLRLGGKDSQSRWVQHLCQTYGGGRIELVGWQESVWDFYDGISLYVQPSATEGFGIEILEALARGRPVICSDQAGAVDLVTADVGWQFKAGDVGALASAIDLIRKLGDAKTCGQNAAEKAKQYTWANVRQQYQALWRKVVG